MGSGAPTGGKLAAIQLGVAVVAAVLAFLVAPDLDSTNQHAKFVDFFATSAQVIAAVLIALAVEARFAVRRVVLALVTAATVAVGEISAVAALSPSLPNWIYRWLFALTVGGGLGGLVAAIVVGAQTLVTHIEEERLRNLAALIERERQSRG